MGREGIENKIADGGGSSHPFPGLKEAYCAALFARGIVLSVGAPDSS